MNEMNVGKRNFCDIKVAESNDITYKNMEN